MLGFVAVGACWACLDKSKVTRSLWQGPTPLSPRPAAPAVPAVQLLYLSLSSSLLALVFAVYSLWRLLCGFVALLWATVCLVGRGFRTVGCHVAANSAFYLGALVGAALVLACVALLASSGAQPCCLPAQVERPPKQACLNSFPCLFRLLRRAATEAQALTLYLHRASPTPATACAPCWQAKRRRHPRHQGDLPSSSRPCPLPCAPSSQAQARVSLICFDS